MMKKKSMKMSSGKLMKHGHVKTPIKDWMNPRSSEKEMKSKAAMSKPGKGSKKMDSDGDYDND